MRGLLLALGLALCAAAQAQTADDDALQARYRRELAACAELSPLHDQDACRKEARNALAEARRGKLADAADAPYQRNAEARCDVFIGQPRAECIDRLHAPTRTEGGVREGGILRERVTTMP